MECVIFWKLLPLYSNQYWRVVVRGEYRLFTALIFVLDLDMHTDAVYYGIEVGVAVQSSGGVGVGAR